jgi:proteic killer suppression protein
MITSFGSKETEKILNGDIDKNLPPDIQQIGRRKLRMLNNSQNLIDLKIPPSNKLEKVSGKMSGFYSIRINDQWRIVFKWDDENVNEVTIMDYHK